MAKCGGNIAKITRNNLEKELDRTVISNNNALNYYIQMIKKERIN